MNLKNWSSTRLLEWRAQTEAVLTCWADEAAWNAELRARMGTIPVNDEMLRDRSKFLQHDDLVRIMNERIASINAELARREAGTE